LGATTDAQRKRLVRGPRRVELLLEPRLLETEGGVARWFHAGSIPGFTFPPTHLNHRHLRALLKPLSWPPISKEEQVANEMAVRLEKPASRISRSLT